MFSIWGDYHKRLCDLDLLERFVIKYFILKVLFNNFIDSPEALENKIKLLNHNFDLLEEDEIKNLLVTLGDNYKNLFSTESKTVSFSNAEFNSTLFQKMKNKGMIKTFSKPSVPSKDIKVTVAQVNQ